MAYLPVAHIAPNYRDYNTWWIKAYEVGTPTPKVMALESDGGTQVVKLQINADGFIVSAGAAIVIPYISDTYDLWMFPTETEADSNDTSNALRIADGSQGEAGSSLSEKIILADGQVDITLTSVTASTAALYIEGLNVDRGRLLSGDGNDYVVNTDGTITLSSSYPAGSVLLVLGFADIDSGIIVSVFGRVGIIISQIGDYIASQITNIAAGNVSSTDVQGAINELDTRTSKVLPQTVSGTLTAGGRINQIRDSGAFTLPLANSLDADTVLVVELPDRYKAQTPTLDRAGSDDIVDGTGTDTDILWEGAAKLTLTTDGISEWSL